MEELSYKLKQNNSILLAQAVSKIVEKIQEKCKEVPERKLNECAELNYLITLSVTAETPLVALTINKGVIHLVESEIISIPFVLSNIISSLSVAKCYEGICYTVCNLLKIDVGRKINSQVYAGLSFNLRSPQHPLITIINREPKTWRHIFSLVKEFYLMDLKSYSHVNKLMFPFYLYVICNPRNESLNEFKPELWRHLICNKKEEKWSDLKLFTLSWLPYSRKNQIVLGTNFLIELLQVELDKPNSDLTEVLCVLLASKIHQSFAMQIDPTSAIACLQNVLHRKSKLQISSCLVLLIANSLVLCPVTHLVDLLQLCKNVLKYNSINRYSLHLLKGTLVQWLAYSCLLTTDSTDLIFEIFKMIETNTMENQTEGWFKRSLYKFLITSNEQVNLVLQVCILSETLNGNSMIKWLENAETLPVFTLKIFHDYLSSLLLNKNCSSVVLEKVIHLLMRIIEDEPKLSTNLLTLILYKLSNTDDAEIHFVLLKTLPRLGVLKENLPLILNTLRLLSGGVSHLEPLAATLFLKLWSVESKCYSYLHEMLLLKCDYGKDEGGWWKHYVCKANILKEICRKKPEVHGRELVLHLSNVLNECGGVEGSTASALAIEGILYLCKAGVIDICSTWSELAPRFTVDRRTQVIVSLCKLLGEFSKLPSTSEDAILTIINQVVEKLWNYATEDENSLIVDAAFEALSMFSLDQICTQLPDSEGFKLSTFSVVTGSYWIHLLEKCKPVALEPASNLLCKFVGLEIAAYRSGIYIVKEGQREPANLNYLPDTSIVRGLGNYLKSKIDNWKTTPVRRTYLQCLKILSKKYKKPLPPMDWCFLQELVHDNEAKFNCIAVASHQVQLSGTARRFIENYIMALSSDTDKEEDILTIYKQMPDLANSIQPVTLRPFFEKTLDTFVQNALVMEKIDDDCPLSIVIDCLQDILATTALRDANRSELNQVLVETIHLIDIDTPVFDKLLECVHVLPKQLIDELTLLQLSTDSSTAQFNKAVKIRCAIAEKVDENRLDYLNGLIDAACSFPSDQQYLFNHMRPVLRKYRDFKTGTLWILDLLCRIQVRIVDEEGFDEHLAFYCEVFIHCILLLSGFDSFTDFFIGYSESRYQLFPTCIAFLLKTPNWNDSFLQVAEWLLSIVSYANTPQSYKSIFYEALLALRNESVIQNELTWIKYASCEIPLCTKQESIDRSGVKT